MHKRRHNMDTSAKQTEVYGTRWGTDTFYVPVAGPHVIRSQLICTHTVGLAVRTSYITLISTRFRWTIHVTSIMCSNTLLINNNRSYYPDCSTHFIICQCHSTSFPLSGTVKLSRSFWKMWDTLPHFFWRRCSCHLPMHPPSQYTRVANSYNRWSISVHKLMYRSMPSPKTSYKNYIWVYPRYVIC